MTLLSGSFRFLTVYMNLWINVLRNPIISTIVSPFNHKHLAVETKSYRIICQILALSLYKIQCSFINPVVFDKFSCSWRLNADKKQIPWCWIFGIVNSFIHLSPLVVMRSMNVKSELSWLSMSKELCSWYCFEENLGFWGRLKQERVSSLRYPPKCNEPT